MERTCTRLGHISDGSKASLAHNHEVKQGIYWVVEMCGVTVPPASESCACSPQLAIWGLVVRIGSVAARYQRGCIASHPIQDPEHRIP